MATHTRRCKATSTYPLQASCMRETCMTGFSLGPSTTCRSDPRRMNDETTACRQDRFTTYARSMRMLIRRHKELFPKIVRKRTPDGTLNGHTDRSPCTILSVNLRPAVGTGRLWAAGLYTRAGHRSASSNRTGCSGHYEQRSCELPHLQPNAGRVHPESDTGLHQENDLKYRVRRTRQGPTSLSSGV